MSTFDAVHEVRLVYLTKTYLCSAGYALRKREWGLIPDLCTGVCTHCAIRNRAVPEADERAGKEAL